VALPAYCGYAKNEQSELNAINKDLGSNPSLSTLKSELLKLKGEISQSASSATGKVKTYFKTLATGTGQVEKSIDQFQTQAVISKSEWLPEIKTLVQAIGTDWTVIKTYAGCPQSEFGL